MRFILFVPLFLACSTSPAFAKEYLGFNFCESSRFATIKKIAIDANADVAPLSDEDTLTPEDNSELKVQNYPIANGLFDVTLRFYAGKLYSASIDDPGILEVLEPALNSKYGKPYKQTTEIIASAAVITRHFYRVPKDSEMEIYLHIFSGRSVQSKSVSYTCRSIERARIDALKRDQEKARKAASTGKSV